MAKNKSVDELIEEVLLQSTYTPAEKYTQYGIPGFKKITIAGPDLHFFEQLRALPPVAKIYLMQLQVADLDAYLQTKKKERSVKLNAYLKAIWKWKETGDDADFTDPFLNEDIFGIKEPASVIQRLVKRGKLSFAQEDAILQYFEGGREVYTDNTKILDLINGD